MKRFQLARTAFSLAAVLALGSCKKETEIQIREKEVDKKYSWSEVTGLSSLERIVLSTGNNGQAIYLQQPYFFTRFTSQSRNLGISVTGGQLTTDLNVRLSIGRDFFAYPQHDSLLVFTRNNEPLSGQAYVQLRRFDPTGIRFNTRVFSLSKCTAINRNNYLLVPYDNNRPGYPFTFLLAAVTPGSAYGVPVSVTTRQVVIPNPILTVSAYVRNIAAVDDYFLANLGAAGIYKIKQDGTFRQVYGPAIVDAFYKWNNIVYAPAEYNKILTSADDGETWQLSSGTPDHFTLASYYTVRDSLVGVYGTNIYTMRWNGLRYVTRTLKSDGLERTTITGIEYLRDTVYVATTSGLFARPVKTFFDTRQ